MNWILEKVLYSLGKTKLLNIVWKIFRKVFKRLYWDMLELVHDAEAEIPKLGGAAKAKLVIERFIADHDEVPEWHWVLNVLLEIAVGEAKSKEEKL